ncbi:MAG: DnaJ domain-containing protein [Hymenobacteraceae bacterium]|nr:DnaJ domain-containing protein [Hymenobacteraceae bacterium]
MRRHLTHYEVLRLDEEASDSQITQAYHQSRMMLECSPQVDPAIRQQLHAVESAYRVLGDKQQRDAYDTHLASLPNPNAKFEAAYTLALKLVRPLPWLALIWCAFLFWDYKTIEPQLEVVLHSEETARYEGGGKFRRGHRIPYFHTTTSGGTFSGTTGPLPGDTLLVWRSEILGKAVEASQVRHVRIGTARNALSVSYTHKRWHLVENLYESSTILLLLLAAVGLSGILPLPRSMKLNTAIASGLFLLVTFYFLVIS